MLRTVNSSALSLSSAISLKTVLAVTCSLAATRLRAFSALIAATAAVRLVKTQTVLDPAGGEEPYAGAVVTYTLRAELSGEGAVSGARVVDAIPAGTTYQAGSLRLDGQAIAPATPLAAQQLGISTVYQEVNLLPNLTVAENLFLGRQPGRFGMVDTRAMNRSRWASGRG